MAGSPHFQKVWYLSAMSQTFGLKLVTDFKNRAEL